MNKTLSTLAFIAIVSVCGYAQQKEKDSIKVNKLEEVVISDTKFPLSKDKSGKVITTISQEDIQKKAGQSLASILSTVAGIEINGNQSANGKNFGTYIRGGNNQQVLIILDGGCVQTTIQYCRNHGRSPGGQENAQRTSPAKSFGHVGPGASRTLD